MNEDLLRDFHAACRREIATAAMAGILSNSSLVGLPSNGEWAAKAAVEHADALLAELGYPYPGRQS